MTEVTTTETSEGLTELGFCHNCRVRPAFKVDREPICEICLWNACTIVSKYIKQKRNAKCNCGSGLKYKRCCATKGK